MGHDDNNDGALISIDHIVLLYKMEPWEWIGIGMFSFALLYITISPLLGIQLLYNKFYNEGINSCHNLGILSKQVNTKYGWLIAYGMAVLTLTIDLIIILIINNNV